MNRNSNKKAVYKLSSIKLLYKIEGDFISVFIKHFFLGSKTFKSLNKGLKKELDELQELEISERLLQLLETDYDMVISILWERQKTDT